MNMETMPLAIAGATLPAMIDRAAAMLVGAKTSAEVLEARDAAQVAIDAAKSASRMARATKAHDEIIAAVYRLQGDALAIQSRAKIRLADEYDAAQDRGEVASNGGARNFSVGNDNAETVVTAADLGLRRDEIHEARQMRDAELIAPGTVENAIRERVDAGQEPTKAAVKDAVEAVTKPFVANNTGNNEWYTPAAYLEAARDVLAGFDLDPASSEIANRLVRADRVFTAENDGLSQDWPIGTIWMNPPYAQPLMGQFAAKFADAIRAGSSGIVLVNNATETVWFQTIAAMCSAICFPQSRIRFLDPQGNPSGAPLQGQAIFYCGNKPDDFQERFGEFGLVVRHGV